MYLLQGIFKAVAQFVKEIQAGGPVQKGADAGAQADPSTGKSEVSSTSTASAAPSQVLPCPAPWLKHTTTFSLQVRHANSANSAMLFALRLCVSMHLANHMKPWLLMPHGFHLDIHVALK